MLNVSVIYCLLLFVLVVIANIVNVANFLLLYRCNYDGCMKQFKQTSHLLRHMQTHEGT